MATQDDQLLRSLGYAGMSPTDAQAFLDRWLTNGPATAGSAGASADDVPSAPNAFDYEFGATDTTSLPAGWSWLNQGGATYRERFGKGYVRCPNSAGTDTRGLVRSAPVGATWEVTAKFNFTSAKNSNYNALVLIMRDNTTGRVFNVMRDTTRGHEYIRWNTATGSFNAESGFIAFPMGSTYYVRIKKNSSSSYDILISTDGAEFTAGWSGVDISAWLASVDQIGFGAYMENGAECVVACEWMRKTA